MTRKYQIISADSHLDLSPDRWRHRVPSKWQDHAPKVIQLPSGADAVVMEGGKPRQISVLSHAGVPSEEIHKQIPTFENSAGCGAPAGGRRTSGSGGVTLRHAIPRPPQPGAQRP